MNILGLEIKRTTNNSNKPAIFQTGYGEAGSGIFGFQEQITKLGSNREQLKAYVDWVYSAVKARSEGIADIELIAYVNRSSSQSRYVARLVHNDKNNYVARMTRKNVMWKGQITGEVKKQPALEALDSHLVIDLIYQPNAWYTKEMLLETISSHLDLTGKAFVYKFKNGGGITEELWPLDPSRMSIVPDSTDFIKGFVYQTPQGEHVPFTTDEVMFFRDIDPANPYSGMGIVQAAARTIDTDTNAADWNRNFFYNAATPLLALTSDNKLDDAAYGRLKESWEARHQGTDNAHKAAILEDGIKVDVIQNTQRDMEFLEGRKFNRDQILAMFRTSASILGLMEDANRSNAETAEYSFAKRALSPRIKRICNTIQEQLAKEMDEKLIIGFEDPVPADKEFELSRKEKSLGKWMTINEVREQEGLDPVEGGDDLYQPISNMPVGMEMPEPVDPTPPPKEPEEDEEVDDEKEEKTIVKGTPSYENNMAIDSSNKLYNGLKQRQLIGDNWANVVDKNAIGYEQPFRTVVRQFAEDQEKAVIRQLKRQLKKDFKPTSAKKLPDLVNFKEWAKKLAKAMIPVYAEEVREVGIEAALLAGLSPTSFDHEDPSIVKFYEQRSTKVSKSVSAETEKQLKATLAEGINAGEGVDKLVGRVSDTYGRFKQSRAEAIARTETIRAAGFAQVEAWEQSGVVEGKEWFTAKDERVCQWCGPMDGSFRYLEQNFHEKGTEIVGEKGGVLKLDYEDIETPPFHVNCRCVLLPFISEGDS